jgi:hypothetical protein
MKLYHNNPRQITDRQYSDLSKWLEKYGDLSGIVHDLNSDEIIGGNQRSRVFNINECEVELTEQYEQPDEQGTVAVGFVIWGGKRYAYRQVRWPEEWSAEANVIANKAGGTFDFDILANSFEVPQLMEWGFTEFELGINNEPLPDFKEYDESVEDEVEYITCPECGHKWPK